MTATWEGPVRDRVTHAVVKDDGDGGPVTDDLVARDVTTRIEVVDGEVDIWPVLRDGALLARVVDALAAPFRAAGVTKVLGIEARGFALGAAVAVELDAGFVPVRKAQGHLPGEVVQLQAPADWRGKRHWLRVQKKALADFDRVVLVDDWLETGSQALTAKQLVSESGAVFVGAAAIVDELADDTRAKLGDFHAMLTARELRG